MHSARLKKYSYSWLMNCDGQAIGQCQPLLKNCAFILVPFSFLLMGCPAKVISPNPVSADPKVCRELPVELVKQNPTLKLAGVKYAELALGELTIKNETEAKSLLTDEAKNAVVRDSIICQAIARTGENKGDPLLKDYFLKLIYFMNATPSPTSEQIQNWVKDHPFPKRMGKLELSGPRMQGKSRVLLIPLDSPEVTMGVINSGEGPLTWWFAHFPRQEFYTNLANGESITLQASGYKEFPIVRTTKAKGDQPYNFKIKANTNEEVEVTIIAQGTEFYASLASKLQQRVKEWTQISAKDTHKENPQASTGDFMFQRSKILLASADKLINERFPGTENKNLIASQILATAGYNEEATISYWKFAQEKSDILPGLPVAAVTSDAQGDTLEGCLMRIPGNSSEGQRMLAATTCERDHESRLSIDSVPGN